MNIERPGFHRVDPAPLRDKLRELRSRHPNPIAWLYTPMALPLLDAIAPRAIVYDCMDELSAFKDPPPELSLREQTLLATADLVFTGGPSLYEARRHLHPNVHCFPSSVDVSHFRQALDRNIAHPALMELPGPKLGFFGVLDERIDLSLIAAIADQRPQWQLILVGPVAKIDADQLPRRANIHYLGQQPYQKLPQFLAAWDICLMPFAMNESTRFISPTKSLEYMAAELPVVSTPVPDVQTLHSDVIDIAHGGDEFIARCEQLLAMSAAARQLRIRRMREKLSRTSWDSTADAMHRLLKGLQASASAAPDYVAQPSAR
jgi:glycosyltransferase involved in cell wall biosynthesis